MLISVAVLSYRLLNPVLVSLLTLRRLYVPCLVLTLVPSFLLWDVMTWQFASGFPCSVEQVTKAGAWPVSSVTEKAGVLPARFVGGPDHQ